MKQIKKFILSFFEDSKLIDEYKIRLENINIKEIDIDELYSKQIPTTFNEDIYQKNLKIKIKKKRKSTVKSNYNKFSPNYFYSLVFHTSKYYFSANALWFNGPV